MRAFWTIRTNAGTGTQLDPNRPNLPNITGVKWVCPGDINVLTGSVQPHRHLLAGAVALPSSQVTGQYQYHYHFSLRVGTSVYQTTVGAPDHIHDDTGYPDYFLLFIVCTDTAYDALITAGVRPVAECSITLNGTVYDIGEMNDTIWSADDLTYWTTIASNVVGLTLPTEVDRGKRLVLFLLGLLQSRRTQDDIAYRWTRTII